MEHSLHGITLAWEYSRASRHEPKPGFWLDAAMSSIRGCGFALGASYSFGAAFGVTFGVLSTIGQAIAYRVGIRPTVDYKPATRPRVTRFQLLAAANRTAGYMVAGYVSSRVAHERDHATTVGLTAGLGIGVVTAIIGSCTPFVEWAADHVPEKRMGVFGVWRPEKSIGQFDVTHNFKLGASMTCHSEMASDSWATVPRRHF